MATPEKESDGADTKTSVPGDSLEDEQEDGLSEPLLRQDGARWRKSPRKTPLLPSAPESADLGGGDAEDDGPKDSEGAWWEIRGDGDGDGEHHYDGTFVPPPPLVPVAEVVPSHPEIVRIVAPAALAAGYAFVATLEDGRAFTVTVTEGDVEEGNAISVPYPREFLATTVVPPSGHWKDGLCACLRFGCCHPMLCLPWFCPFVALGQVMTRMKLSWLGNPGPESRTKQTFKILVFLALLHLLFAIIFGCIPGWKIDSTSKRVLAAIALFLVMIRIYLTATTRRRVREKYDIPPDGACCGCCGCFRGCCGSCCCHSCCEGCFEDWCRALLCGCCTMAQIGRHTADYETYRGVCCTSTGLPVNAPIV